MARVIKGDGIEAAAHSIRALGQQRKPAVVLRPRESMTEAVRLQGPIPGADSQQAQLSEGEDRNSAFVAMQGIDGVEVIALTDRQLPPASDVPRTEQMEREEFAREAERLRRLVQRVVERVLRERQNAVHAARGQIVELAMAIAERVVRRAASADRGIAERAVAEALTHVHGRERVRVRLSPGDLESVRKLDMEAAAGFASIDHLELVEDADVEVGGCIVETETGSLDGRIETQLAEIEHALLDALKTGRVDEPA